MRKVIYILIIAISWAACSDDADYDWVDISSTVGDEVIISASVASSTTTRSNPLSTDGQEKTLNTGDRIGVSGDSIVFLVYEKTSDNKWENISLKYKTLDWSMVYNEDYISEETQTKGYLVWPADTTDGYHFWAYYPVRKGLFYDVTYISAVLLGPDSVSYYHFALLENQCNLDSLAYCDYMQFDTIIHGMPEDRTLNINFKRKMALMEVEVSKIVDYIGTSSSAKVDSVHIYSPHYKYINHQPHGDITEISSYRPDADKDIFYAILIPTDTAMTDSTFLDIYLQDTYGDNKTKRTTISTCTGIPAMKAGKKYKATVTAYWDRVEIDNITVEDWTESTATLTPTKESNITYYYDLDNNTSSDGTLYASLSTYLTALASTDIDGETIYLSGEISGEDMYSLITFFNTTVTGKSVALDMSDVTNDTIPSPESSSGTSINYYLYNNGASLSIGGNLTGNGAQSSLTRLVLPKDSVVIGARAFINYQNLSKIENCSYVTAIEDYAFCWCTSLATINFANAKTIGDGAFAFCTALTSPSFAKATKMGAFAFVQTTSLASVEENYFPAVIDVGRWAFAYSAIKSVVMPKAATLGAGAFNGFSSYGSYLTTASFPSSVTIGDSCFAARQGLTSIILGPVEEMGNNAFMTTPYLALLDLSNCTKVPKIWTTTLTSSTFVGTSSPYASIVVADTLYDTFNNCIKGSETTSTTEATQANWQSIYTYMYTSTGQRGQDSDGNAIYVVNLKKYSDYYTTEEDSEEEDSEE